MWAHPEGGLFTACGVFKVHNQSMVQFNVITEFNVVEKLRRTLAAILFPLVEVVYFVRGVCMLATRHLNVMLSIVRLVGRVAATGRVCALSAPGKFR